MLLNLINNHFQNSNLFRSLPLFDEIYYEGQPEGKIQLYRALRENHECGLLTLSIIRKDEDVFWDSAEDFLDRAIKSAAAMIQGVYSFDLLTFDIHHELKTFNIQQMSQLIANHARKLKIGGMCLVKYSTLYGILQKRLDERWGKITLKTSVEVYKDTPAYLYLLTKRFWHAAPALHAPVIGLIHDVSLNPLFDPGDAIQSKGFQQALKEWSEHCIDFLPELYIQDKNGTRELLSGTVFS